MARPPPNYPDSHYGRGYVPDGEDWSRDPTWQTGGSGNNGVLTYPNLFTPYPDVSPDRQRGRPTGQDYTPVGLTRISEDPVMYDEDLHSFTESDFGYQSIPQPHWKTSSEFGLIRRDVAGRDEVLQHAHFELTKLKTQFFDTAESWSGFYGSENASMFSPRSICPAIHSIYVPTCTIRFASYLSTCPLAYVLISPSQLVDPTGVAADTPHWPSPPTRILNALKAFAVTTFVTDRFHIGTVTSVTHHQFASVLLVSVTLLAPPQNVGPLALASSHPHDSSIHTPP
ncbi:hypothetical protein PISMIDRAFT_24814 [Pisolithus microcarpus 441]|uniref:Unplaced genomic scaffold scaffold_136, whole genome shotgun sequence n=1 Tax=Pisolithus microcarpus 441 TaxID=765257 RepID=A0A0C9YUQ1_9AGAM|nr:hypothetical protein PISMIDRAFT_24814 [Pisolithus microcarpus 441]